MQKLITRICWTSCGVDRFTDEVNAHLEEGWNLTAINIEKKGLRFVCFAILADLPLEPQLGQEASGE